MEAAAQWNVLVTAQEGFGGDLRRALRPFGHFWWSRYRNVVLGRVEALDPFLASLTQMLEEKPSRQAWLGRVLPIDATFPVTHDDFLAEAERQIEPRLDEIVPDSFHVRVERRGHRGALRTDQLEREIGDFVVAALRQRGRAPRVRFDDAGTVIALEIVGATAGLALIGRELRRRYSVIKID